MTRRILDGISRSLTALCVMMLVGTFLALWFGLGR